MIQQFSSVISEIPSLVSDRRSSSVPPPETKDEWLRRESIPEWPRPLHEDDEVSVENITSVLDSVENVERDLKNHASKFHTGKRGKGILFFFNYHNTIQILIVKSPSAFIVHDVFLPLPSYNCHCSTSCDFEPTRVLLTNCTSPIEYDSNFLDTVSKKLAELETNMTYLSDFFLSDTQQQPRTARNSELSNLPRNSKSSRSF